MSKLLTNRQIKSFIKQSSATHRVCMENACRQMATSKDPEQVARLSQASAQHALIKGALDQLLQDIEELEEKS